MSSNLDREFLERIKKLEQKLGYVFKDKNLPLTALTHSSFAAEYHKEIKDYEVLEFLGDAVLSLIVSEILIKTFPEASEGELSQTRSAVISEAYLSRLARILGLNELVLLSRGEIAQKGMERESLLCDVFESVFGAVYVDCDYDIKIPREIFNRFFKDYLIESIKKGNIPRDYKSILQIMTQRLFGVVPKYSMVSAEGPEHEKIFTMECSVDNVVRTFGTGKSKKEAETEAAKKAYFYLKERYKDKKKRI
ncbi:MAG TPA: ribonuclease III [Persephonella sp.]|uniref:Ribonuclease 3 n=1 Tax=Persephonella marina (strain DSM 14350 / EX-H1) TaxID=123214 RepID=C0QUD5_PERMH|nr:MULTISPECIES: ribonuclease III [Persephonella]ACO03294.1 ribonuclease III [Persephonella marina EX-H1]HCB70081.1 ribonuclease III [Persephonella sp.]